MEKYNWTVSFFDELDDNQEMNIAHIVSKDDPDCLIYALHEHFGWNKTGLNDLNTSDGLKKEVNGVEMWFVVNRGCRGHVLVMTAIKLKEAK